MQEEMSTQLLEPSAQTSYSYVLDSLFVMDPDRVDFPKRRVRQTESCCSRFKAALGEVFGLCTPCFCPGRYKERVKEMNTPRNRIFYFGRPWDENTERNYLMQAPRNKGQPTKFLDKRSRSNYISTTKYTVVTFLPLNLFEQLQNKANFYFLIVAIISFTSLSPKSPFFSVTPLCFVLGISAIKEAWEDYQRYKMDQELNHNLVDVWDCVVKLDDSGEPIAGEWQMTWVRKTWQEIEPGDVVRITRENSRFPADLILLQSSSENGGCFMETSNLDGETNLKPRQALGVTYSIQSDPAGQDYCHNLVFKLESSPPNERMDKTSWHGNLTVVPKEEWQNVFTEINQDEVSPEDINLKNPPYNPGWDQFLPRGASLRNTDWVISMVMFTGRETKLLLNSKYTAFKRSNLEKILDLCLYILFGLQLLICCLGAMARYLYLYRDAQHMWYQDIEADGYTHDTTDYFSESVFSFFTFLVLLDLLIPISLIVSMEMVKLAQAYFINCDEQMRNPETKELAQARTSKLNEELGQVNFIFSDKTGTLTRNMMEFHSCFVKDTLYGERPGSSHLEPFDLANEPMPCPLGNPPFDVTARFRDHRLPRRHTDRHVNEFFTLMAVCHSVVPEEGDTEEKWDITYQASSPDEKALVLFAKNMYYWFQKSETTRIQFQDELIDGQHISVVIQGRTQVFDSLVVIPFSSDRKRMSVLVRDPRDGKLKLYTKGADSVIRELLTEESRNEDWPQADAALTGFATQGLRTLACAYRVVPETEFESFLQKLKVAKNTFERRDERVLAVQETLEVGLKLLGVTAIEDRLQDDVPRVISNLCAAGCAFWVLTGDKVETAINIARAARLLKPAMQTSEGTLVVIDVDENLGDDDGYERTKEVIENAWRAVRDNPLNDANQGLVLSGKALNFVFPVRRRTRKGLEIPPTRAERVKEIELQELVLKICRRCRAVIACRVSPKQKSQIVYLVKNNLKVITLAIGDGANDVPMIKAAHVGVGVVGKEGLQAVMSSDYAITRFKDVERLMLVHGAWAYRRLAKLILYTFYKNMVISMIQIWYQVYCQYSGALYYDSMAGSCYNMIFTAFPVLILGIFDRPYSEKTAIQWPELYAEGPRDKKLNLWWFLGYQLKAVVTSLVIFLLTFHLTDGAYLPDGKVLGLWSTITVMFSVTVLTVTGSVMMDTYTWTRCNLIWFVLSPLSWFAFALLWTEILPPEGGWYNPMYYKVPEVVMGTPIFWLQCFMIPTFILMPEVAFRYFRRRYFPKRLDFIQAAEVLYGANKDPDRDEFEPVAGGDGGQVEMSPSPGLLNKPRVDAGSINIDTTSRKNTEDRAPIRPDR